MSSLSDKLDNEDLPQPLQDSSSQNNESSLEPSPGVQKTPSNENDKFFMALAFLASTRSKDGMTQVKIHNSTIQMIKRFKLFNLQ